MRDLSVTIQGTVTVNTTVDKFRFLKVIFNPPTKEITVEWEKGVEINNVFTRTSTHKTVFSTTSIITDGTMLPNPVANPYNTLAVKINGGDFSPESTLAGFLEYVLTTYAEI